MDKVVDLIVTSILIILLHKTSDLYVFEQVDLIQVYILDILIVMKYDLDVISLAAVLDFRSKNLILRSMTVGQLVRLQTDGDG